MFSMILQFADHHDVICDHNHISYVTKILIQVALEHISTTVAPNGMTVYLKCPISVLKVVRNEECSSSSWYQ